MMILKQIHLPLINNSIGKIILTYEVFGQALHSAPIILINHALTGNSSVIGHTGWWNDMVGDNKTIDTLKYTVITFNIPGNGYDSVEANLIDAVDSFSTKHIATYFWTALLALNIHKLFAIVGGSLGGAIAWEMAFQQPTKIKKLIPIATNFKSSDWLIGNVFIQNSILENSSCPIQDARKHAMFLYRCPEGINQKFDKGYLNEKNRFAVENWLEYHGNALKDRFTLKAYKLMNHLLKTIGQDITETDLINFTKLFSGDVHLVAVDSDLMFTAKEQYDVFKQLRNKIQIQYSEIKSIHGHDAFLIEFMQLHQILKSHF